MKKDTPINDEYLTKEEFRQAFNLKSTRTVDMLIRSRKIAVTRFGHRTIRISLSAARRALEKLTIKEIGG